MKEKLIGWADKYESIDFIKDDPIQIPHRYDSKVNIEISAFVTSWISWGSRKQIIKMADFIDKEIFNEEPYHYIMGNNTGIDNVPLWHVYKDSKECFYRTFTYNDFSLVCERLYKIYSYHQDMETAILDNAEGQKAEALKELQLLFGDINGLPDIYSKSACKRLCMFLRWMCRKDSPVDFGIWSICKPKDLIIPLDTHVHKQSLKLGITTRKTPDLQTAIEITNYFAGIFLDDPAKGDFALFGYSVNNLKESSSNLDNELNKNIENINLSELTIIDVLKMPLFYENLCFELENIWNSREKARKGLKSGERLKSHPIDQIQSEGLLQADKFIIEYTNILDGISILPRAIRDVIQTLGNTAFNKTMKKLIEDQKDN